MSRSRRFHWSLMTSYLVLLVQVINAAVSIPLALSYLDKSWFGVWVLTSQLIIFYQMVDLGFSEAFVRLLIEFKDKGEEAYLSGIKTAIVVFSVQGALLLIVMMPALGLAPRLLKLEGESARVFVELARAQTILFCGANISRIFEQVLFVNQRIAVSNLATVVGIPLGLLVAWISFLSGLGVWSLFTGQLALMLILVAIRSTACLRLKLLDRRVLVASASMAQFREVFIYGKDRFLATFGDRLLRILPGFVITRVAGLEANAAWGVGQKIIQLLEQVISKPIDMAYPFLAEMHIKCENDRFNRRFSQICHVVSLSGGLAACAMLAGMGLAVLIWTQGEVELGPKLVLSFTLLLVAQLIKRTLWPTVTIPKDMGWTRLTNFTDVVICLGLSALAYSSEAGLAAYVAAAAVATVGTSVPYMAFRASRFPGLAGWSEVGRRYVLLASGLGVGLIGWAALGTAMGVETDLKTLLQRVLVAGSMTFVQMLIGLFFFPELRSRLIGRLRM